MTINGRNIVSAGAGGAGALSTSMSTLIAGENLTTNRLMANPVWNFTNIVTATTTIIKSGAGTFGGIIFNKRIATGVTTMYDNTSAAGTKIGTITEGAAILGDPPQAAQYNVSFATGLTIVTSQAEDITVAWM